MITLAWLIWQTQVIFHASAPSYYPAPAYDEPPKYVQRTPVAHRQGTVKPER